MGPRARPRARWTALLPHAALAGALVLLALAPPVRQALIMLAPAVTPLLLLAALAWVGARALARALGHRARERALRRQERRLGGVLARLGWAPAVLLWLLPLVSHWSGRPPDALAEWLAPLGHIPWSDGYGYFEGAQQLLWDGRFGRFAEQKPIFPALLAVGLALTKGSVPAVLVARAVLLGLASFLSARQVGLHYGTWCATSSFALLLGLDRGVVPALVTEPLGSVFGCLAVAVLASTAARRRVGVFAAGLFLLAVALQVRPGAQLVLPALALWGGWHFRARWRSAVVVAIAAVVAANLVTTVLDRWYGAGESSFYARPAFYLYGLAHGSNEERASEDFSAQADSFASEREFARFVYAQAFFEIRRNPTALARACASGMARLVEKGFKDLVYVANPARIRPYGGEGREPTWPGKVVLAILVLTALARAWRSRERSFWIAVAGGTLASGLFVGTNLGFHGVAAVFPLLTVAVTLGVAGGPIPRRALAGTAAEREESGIVRAAVVAAVVLLALAMIGPAWARQSWPRPAATMLVGMRPGRDLVLLRETSPAVTVGTGGMRVRQYRDLLDLGGTDMDVVQATPPFAVLSAWDFVARRQRVVYAPAEVGRVQGFVHLLIEEEARAPNGQGVVRAGAWNPLGPWK
jgi:hypothetical protein